ncbi:MAG: hypothetical protein ACRDV4_00440 [Acidimicrobiales bacterium]
MSAAAETLASLGRLGELMRSSRADAEVAKSYCAAAYGIDLVELFLGDSYHPGGAR